MSTNYTALARRFRPQAFEEVVGQDRVARTLRNAILENRVAHAYLFTGARGVGKTSMARIFAKALNCPQSTDAVSCNTCEVCTAVAAGQDVDVSEIDGASNRGIDDIRKLRENVNIRSMRSPYKIYIIDEVHMLTKEAFNALLKTLEEPPPKVKFIFCTTEPQKVPDTILSRCQRFDFGAIPTRDIAGRLRQLADLEGFTVEEGAIQVVARRAAGSMRDSQSLFDQLLAAGERHIGEADVHRLLGTAPDDHLVRLGTALVQREAGVALQLLDDALTDGAQLEPVTDQLVGLLRDALVLAAGGSNLALQSVGPSRREELHAIARTWGLHTTMAALQVLSETKLRMQRVTFSRALVELALVRVATLADMDQLERMIHQVSQLPAGGAAAPLLPALPREAPARVTQQPMAVPAPSIAPQPALGEPPLPKREAGVAGREKDSVKNGTLRESAPTSEILSDKPAELEWGKMTGDELLTAVLRELQQGQPMLGSALKQGVKCAISGPNAVEMIVPNGYDLVRRQCESAEGQEALVETIRKLTGVNCRVLVRVDPRLQATVVEQKSTAAPPPNSRAVEVAGDVFVDEVGKLLGIGAWIKQVSTPAADAGSVAEPEEEVDD